MKLVVVVALADPSSAADSTYLHLHRRLLDARLHRIEHRLHEVGQYCRDARFHVRASKDQPGPSWESARPLRRRRLGRQHAGRLYRWGLAARWHHHDHWHVVGRRSGASRPRCLCRWNQPNQYRFVQQASRVLQHRHICRAAKARITGTSSGTLGCECHMCEPDAMGEKLYGVLASSIFMVAVLCVSL
jgi:hypothetical protein